MVLMECYKKLGWYNLFGILKNLGDIVKIRF